MSNDKQCEKHCRLKFKVSKTRLFRFGINRSLRIKTKVLFNEINKLFCINVKVTKYEYYIYFMVKIDVL